LARGGGETRIESQGVKDWGYQAGGYKVTLGYHISTPEGSCDLDVTLLSSEGRKRGSPRQWVVVRDGTGLRTAIEGTPLGLRVLKLQFQALPLAQNWFRNMATGQTPAAYLETVDPARREPLFAEAESRLALSDLAALPCLEFGGPNLAPGQL